MGAADDTHDHRAPLDQRSACRGAVDDRPDRGRISERAAAHRLSLGAYRARRGARRRAARPAWVAADANETLPPLDHGVLLAIARVTHWLLYALLIVTVGFGIANVWVRGDSIFNLFRIPPYDPGNRDLMHLIGDRHALFANAVLIVAGLHAAAALFHHYILRDATLRRMLP